MPSIECSLNKLEKRHTYYTVQRLLKQPLSEIFSEDIKNLGSNCNIITSCTISRYWDFKAQELLCLLRIIFYIMSLQISKSELNICQKT